MKLEELPWDYEGMVFTEGRYYHAMWNLPIPKWKNFPLGGDILLLLWRYDASRLHWVLTGRIRKNLDAKIFDSDDLKSWFAVRVEGPDESMQRQTEEVLDKMSGNIGLAALENPPKLDVILIKGDCNKAFEVLQNANRSWLHVGLSPKP